MNKKISKTAKAFFTLALLLVFGINALSPVRAAESKIIEITTAKQLKDFSKKCAADSFSKGLTVKLMGDIDLEGASFSPIPIFYGTFDGQGHEIKGFKIAEKGSVQGFFRSLNSSAVIKRLTLSGAVSPTGTACSAGILAGENYGIITDCIVTGSIVGDADVGAVAGVNQVGGLVAGCSSEAAVTGVLRTGGLVGKNLGTIEESVNKGEVNTSLFSNMPSAPNSLAEADAGGIVPSAPDNSHKDVEEQAGSSSGVSDTGGICGKNEGRVRGCTNYGAVGCKYSGCNTGGIAGNHDGIITGCENCGEISGYRDVGGIAGQFEPAIALTFVANSVENLEKELDTLSSILQNLKSSLTGCSAASMDSAHNIDDSVNIINGALKARSDASAGELDAVLDELSGCLQAINTSAGNINSYIKDFTSIADTEISAINSGLCDSSAAIEGAGVSVEAADIATELDKFKRQIQDVSGANGSIEALAANVSTVIHDETLTKLQRHEQIQMLLNDYYSTAAGKTTASDVMASIKSCFVAINQRINTINAKLGNGTTEVARSLQAINSSAARLQRSFSEFSKGVLCESEIIDSNIGKIEFTLNTYLSNAADRLNTAFDTVYDCLNLINLNLSDISANADDTSIEVNALLNSAVNQLDIIATAVLNMLDEPKYSSVEVSENIELDEKPGQISSCRNSGDVWANENVGGIAGIMALEACGGPEEDFSMPESLWADNTALFRAIIMSSSSTGAITAENDCAGGAVGRCDVGVIYKTDCEARIETINGSKCGGIAGSSESGIIRCNALCELAGNNNIGGIVGLGVNISNCRSMVLIDGGGKCIGAVAGAATGEIVGNAFVEEQLHGINGVSYAGMAYPLPYESFIAIEQLPAMFTDLHVDFYIEDALLKRFPITYGGSVPSWAIPSLPAREDSFGAWEPFKTENLIRSVRVNAVYAPWISTLSSGGEFPLMLAEGKFSGAATLNIEEAKTSAAVGKTYRNIAAYAYSIVDESGEAADEYSIRLRCDKPKNAVVGIVEDGKIRQITASRDGRHLVFKAPPSGELIILEPLAGRLVAVSFIILSVLIALGFYWYIQKNFPNYKQSGAE